MFAKCHGQAQFHPQVVALAALVAVFGFHARTNAATFSLAGACSLAEIAAAPGEQIGRPPVNAGNGAKGSPKGSSSNSPGKKPTPQPKARPLTRKDLDARKENQNKQPRPAVGGKKPAKPAPKLAAAKALTARELREGEKVLKFYRRAHSQAKDEVTNGSIKSLGAGAGPSLAFSSWRLNRVKHPQTLILKHDRGVSLPPILRLAHFGSKKPVKWWSCRPEASRKKAPKPDSATTLAGKILRFDDFLPPALSGENLTYLGRKIKGGRQVHQYRRELSPKTKADGKYEIISLRADLNLVSHSVSYNAKGVIVRERIYDKLKIYGIFKRWLHVLIRDHRSDQAVLVEYSNYRVNTGMDPKRFELERLAEFFEK